MTQQTNKLECLSLSSNFTLAQHFEPILSVENLTLTPVLVSNVGLGRKDLQRRNTLAYFDHNDSDDEKKFCSTVSAEELQH